MTANPACQEFLVTRAILRRLGSPGSQKSPGSPRGRLNFESRSDWYPSSRLGPTRGGRGQWYRILTLSTFLTRGAQDLWIRGPIVIDNALRYEILDYGGDTTSESLRVSSCEGSEDQSGDSLNPGNTVCIMVFVRKCSPDICHEFDNQCEVSGVLCFRCKLSCEFTLG